MPDEVNSYATLPAVVVSTVGEARKQDLILTIVFHPDTSRIGATASVSRPRGEDIRVLGRNRPQFSIGSDPARPINDRYISRAALQLRYRGGDIIVRRGSSSSRARVGSHELVDEICLSGAALAEGVPIVLGGRVVLLLRRTEYLSQASAPGSTHALDLLRGSSAYMRKLREQIFRLATTNLDLLVRGETGTGKELVAQAVHSASAHVAGNMVSVNMAAIPVSLAASILFGSAKGAFSGADKASIGYFEQARGGTLFLDEIGDTPPEIQAQLLRVLQQREIQCVGGPVRKVELRVVSATDASLDDQSCNFKAALRHRLGESEISLLPLRKHPEDIGELLIAFLTENFTSQGRGDLLPDENCEASEIARWAEMFYLFVCYRWPGNIREMRNYAQQVAVASDSKITVPDLVLTRISTPNSANTLDTTVPARSIGKKCEPLSNEAFLAWFQEAEYEVARAARAMGISRQAVYRRISDIPGLCLANELPVEKIQAAWRSCGGDLAAVAAQLRVSRTALRVRMRNVPTTLAG